MGGSRQELTSEEAAALWARAAELQEAARRAASKQTEQARDSLAASSASVSYEIARQAAVESGIDERFVESAAMLLAVEPHLDTSSIANWAARSLGFADHTLAERVVVQSPVGDVRQAIAAVTGTDSFQSDPVEIVSEDHGHVALVYEVAQNLKVLFNEDSFHYQVRQSAEVKRYAVVLMALDDESCEITVHVSLDRALATHAGVMRAVQAAGGIGAAVGAGFGANAIVGAIGLAGALGPVLIGVIVAGAGVGAVALFGTVVRFAFRKATQKLRSSFRKFLTAVRMRLER